MVLNDIVYFSKKRAVKTALLRIFKAS